MKSCLALLGATWLLLAGCSTDVEWTTDNFSLRISDSGDVVELADKAAKTDYLFRGVEAPLLSFRIDGVIQAPVGAEVIDGSGILRLTFPDGRRATVSVTSHPTHLRFELIDVSPRTGIELALWGPYPTVLNEVIGETVGVVQGDDFAIGIQSLNPKTLGGYPWNENDALPQLDIFESGDYSDLNPAGKRGVLYRVEAAKPDSFGSTLQAFTRERNVDRVIENRGYDHYVAPAYDDGGVVGSSIALFGVPVDEALTTIGEIELAEGLPHPMIDGEWGKMAKGASAAYIIMGFGENDIERALDVTKKAGLRYLYHSDPFQNWGHFDLKPSFFPRGVESLKSMTASAEADGVMLGVHMLSNFITPNDPYVTPVPDERLAKVGSTKLSISINETIRMIPIEDPTFFNQSQKSHLRATLIDDEIVQCNGITDSKPWRLLDCDRGAFGTTPAQHTIGTTVAKLDDHGYNVFLSSTDLSIEMAQRVAALFNEAGLRQISFDGLEGNRSTGMGNYGEILFTQSWFDALDDNIRAHYIADASRTSHFFWHMYTRMNWGEPWYAGFRESQTEYRLKNQAYFRRNMMPGMLGWFSMQPETSVEDIEWMLARSAGFDAGYGFVTGYDRLEQNGVSDEILELLGRWETARMAGVFTEEQKLSMQNIENEFHLDQIDVDTWDLYPITSQTFSHQNRERQPGEPDFSSFRFSSETGTASLAFILTAIDAPSNSIQLELDNNAPVRLDIQMPVGHHVKYSGGTEATLYSDTWQVIRTIPVPESPFALASGDHEIRLRANQSLDGELKMEIRLVGKPERIEAEKRNQNPGR